MTRKHGLETGLAVVFAIAGAKLLLHLAAASRYGYFGDELYFLACGEHLDWGYVDQPPLIGVVAWLVRHTLGTSLLALRLLSALAGAALVVLTGLVAREMGGGRFAMGPRLARDEPRLRLRGDALPLHDERIRAAFLDGVRWLWGPGDSSKDVFIVLGDRPEQLQRWCGDVQVARELAHPLTAVWEHGPVLVCRQPRMPLREIWPKVKNWD